MRRRTFIAGLGSAAAWPLAARAQQGGQERRRVGILMGWGESDPGAMADLSGFLRELSRLGWSEGGNVRIDIRWTAGSTERMREFAKELVGLRPDVILAGTTPVPAALQRETTTIPIVFVTVSDPVGAGFVASLSRPGGNITGFIHLEASFSGKWLELLREIAYDIKRAAILFNPDTAPGGGSYFLPSFELAARSFGVEPIVAPVRSDGDIEMVMASLARQGDAGLVAMSDAFVSVKSEAIISLAARHNVPAVYSLATLVRAGGLISYGTDESDVFRRAAAYVDRILRGARPSDLPVQLPEKFQMGLNLKTAKALGLAVPQSIMLRADEVIE